MNVAFIPVRGGSKSIPLKNIKEIAGKPLIYWTVSAANSCISIDIIYVSTDSPQIRKVVESFGFEKVIVIDRSADTASDTASTESAMLEFANNYEFDNIVLIQATSPLLREDDLNEGFEIYRTDNTDSVLSVVKQKRFIWSKSTDGSADSVNYDYRKRPRRQEFDGYYVENGAFYITNKERLLETGNRISGRIKISQMDESTYYEIDDPSDWIIIENQLKQRLRKKENIFGEYKIEMFLMDCDGVLTDGGMYYSENGDELKRFNTQDGMGIQLLKQRGVITGIITGENRALNAQRAEKLKIDIVRQGVSDKLAIVKELCIEYGIDLMNIAFVGDDINDLPVIKEVGLGCTVFNGRPEIKECAKYISPYKGGDGAVRDIIDKVLEWR